MQNLSYDYNYGSMRPNDDVTMVFTLNDAIIYLSSRPYFKNVVWLTLGDVACHP